MSKKIIVVDDEADLRRMLAYHLEREGFESVLAENGAEAIKKIQEGGIDLMILDLMMPGENGFQICRRIRSQAATVYLPIILLTARDAENDKVFGLESGADDYVTKPFSPKELMARIKALLRRSPQNEETTVYIYETLTMDLSRHEVHVLGEQVVLTVKEFSLLELLLKHKGDVLTRDAILRQVWGYGYFGTTRTVDVHIRRLREKMPLLAKAIKTLPSLGYKLTHEE